MSITTLARWAAVAVITASLGTLPSVTALDVTAKLDAPADAPLLSKSLVSISIEQDGWPEWTGIEKRNQFFYNTFDNLRALTGAPPDVRVGANSEDRTNFDPSIRYHHVQQGEPPSPRLPYPETGAMTVGDGFYEVTKFLLPGTHVTFGVNMGTRNHTAAYLMAESITKAFRTPAIKKAGIVLDFIEIGNEPNLYALNGLRGPTYNVSDYVPDWTAFSRNISGVAGITPTSHVKFLGGSLGGGRHGWNPRSLAEKGLFDTPEGKLITTISQHRYSGSFCSGDGALLQALMTKANIRGNTTIFAPDAADAKAMGFRYVLGETNSMSCHGAPGVSSRAGAALWAIDYVLSAVKIGVEQVFFHDGIGYKYNLLQPVPLTRDIETNEPFDEPQPPHVHPQYYAAIILSEANGKRPTKVSEIDVANSEITAWGFYENGKLKRAVFVHLKAWLPESVGSRAVEHIDLGFDEGRGGFKGMEVKRLAIGFADDKAGVTWGGQTYETPDGRVSGKLQVERVPVTAGFDLHASEAVMLTFT